MPVTYRVTIHHQDQGCRVTLTDDHGTHLYTAEVSCSLPSDSQRRAIMDMARYLHWFARPED
ncbi:hypothetical protein EB061_13095 [bacterium]|nr:hypothetical protein [bacterium]